MSETPRIYKIRMRVGFPLESTRTTSRTIWLAAEELEGCRILYDGEFLVIIFCFSLMLQDEEASRGSFHGSFKLTFLCNN